MKGETDGVVAAVAGGRRRGRERNEEEEEEWRGRACGRDRRRESDVFIVKGEGRVWLGEIRGFSDDL